MTPPGTLYTVSAPSGAGKTSLVAALAGRAAGLRVSVSHTTRPKRPGEREGVDYHFVSEATFGEMSERGAFLEQARVFDNRYGTSRDWVERQMASGVDVLLEIDWQGAAQIKRLLPDCVAIFILPPSRAALRERLQSRGQDDERVIEQRLAEAVSEISRYREADFVVVNDDFERSLAELDTILRSQRLCTAKQAERQRALLDELLS